jgi:hypothetical protein
VNHTGRFVQFNNLGFAVAVSPCENIHLEPEAAQAFGKMADVDVHPPRASGAQTRKRTPVYADKGDPLPRQGLYTRVFHTFS